MSIFNRFGRSRSARRLDAHRLDANGGSGWLTHLRVSGATIPLLITLGFSALAVGIVLSGEERLPWVVNQTVETPLIARVEFVRANQAKTAQATDAAYRATPNYYKLNQALLDRVAGELNSMLADARAADDFAKFNEAVEGRWKLDKDGFDLLRKLGEGKGPTRFDELAARLVQKLAGENLVQRPTAAERDRSRESSEDAVLRRGDGRTERISKQRLSYASNEQHVTRLAKELAEIFPFALRPAVADIVVGAIRVDPASERYEPVYTFDSGATQAALESARNIPTVMDRYPRGAVLAPAGSVITPELLELVRDEHNHYLDARQSSIELYRSWICRRVGQAGIVVLVTLGVALYARRYQPKIARDPAQCTALAGLLLLAMAAARLTVAGNWSEYWSLAPMTTAAAILTIVYSHRFAFGVSAALAALMTLTLNGSFELFLVLTAVAAVPVFMLGDIRSRMKLLYVGGWSGAAAGLLAWLVGLTQQQALGFVATQAGIAGLAVFAACCLVLVLLPVIERAFGVATSMTLLEWADTSTPLLKQLIQRAPGTWQHSHLLGSMAESAADEIGANALLARVGAYYHDIGKMCKPEYFVENQPGEVSAHSRLAPRMSLLIITGHIKDGLALAEEYGLPRVLHPFIAEHHGTTVVRYFHAVAAQRELSKGRFGDERAVDETEFRYPGPKPRTKETAILMLCDSVEGAVRSLAEPTPSRIETVVHEIVMSRLMDGQLDDCDITLAQLARVEQSLVRSLCSIYHGRIAYPKTPEPAAPPPLPVQTRSA